MGAGHPPGATVALVEPHCQRRARNQQDEEGDFDVRGRSPLDCQQLQPDDEGREQGDKGASPEQAEGEQGPERPEDRGQDEDETRKGFDRLDAVAVRIGRPRSRRARC